MPAKVILKVTKGKLQGQQFVFDERTTCIAGRSKECNPQLPNDEDHKTISRHHCLLDINPPDIRVRDFGSMNGTHVNGEKIGQREKGMTPEEGQKMTFPEYDLKEGDEVRLASTTFAVDIYVPAVCAECTGEIPEDQKAQAERSPGVYQCEACYKKAGDQRQPIRRKARVCAQCGRDVTEEMGERRQGDFICAVCQADPFQLIKGLLEIAKTGKEELLAIQGYRILRELGKGGMGAVYLARQDRTGDQVALKVMLPKVAVQERSKEMFLRETENTKALQHSHVVQLLEAGCSQGTFFFTLEYCDGGSVDQLMRQRGGTLSIDEAAKIVLQVLDGLEYAHQAEIPNIRLADGRYISGRGLVHRDLKPSNLFLSGNGSSHIAKVGDFGLAKAFDTAGLSGQTYTGSKAGTPVFMPRQQVVNFKYSKPEVDVWAMAASFYYMLTGFFPRDFPSGQDPWQVVLNNNPVPICQRKSSIPKKLAEVVDLALVDKPKLHYKSAAEFKRALEDVL